MIELKGEVTQLLKHAANTRSMDELISALHRMEDSNMCDYEVFCPHRPSCYNDGGCAVAITMNGGTTIQGGLVFHEHTKVWQIHT